MLLKKGMLFFFQGLSASFSAKASSGSSGGGGREILVQHLLVKEDDQKRLLELQQRVSAGLFGFMIA